MKAEKAEDAYVKFTNVEKERQKQKEEQEKAKKEEEEKVSLVSLHAARRGGRVVIADCRMRALAEEEGSEEERHRRPGQEGGGQLSVAQPRSFRAPTKYIVSFSCPSNPPCIPPCAVCSENTSILCEIVGAQRVEGRERFSPSWSRAVSCVRCVRSKVAESDAHSQPGPSGRNLAMSAPPSLLTPVSPHSHH